MLRTALLLLMLALALPTARAGGQTLTDSEVRMWAEVLASTDSRSADEVLLERGMASANAALRAYAALAAGQLHVATARPRLVELLRDQDPAVAANAAFALGLLADSGDVGALRGAVRSHPRVGSEAAWALGQIGLPARSAIEGLLREPPGDPAVQGALLLSAQKLSPPPVELLDPFLASPNDEVQWRAAYVIARGRGSAGLRKLLPLARARSAQSRALVARALTRAAVGDSLADTARVLLVGMLSDPHEHVRINAIQSLAGFGAEHLMAILPLCGDRSPGVRMVAAQSVANLGRDDAATMRRAWAYDSSYTYRRLLLDAGFRRGTLLAELDSWVVAADPRLRSAAVEVAGSAAPDRYRGVVARMVSDRAADVRQAVIALVAMRRDSIPGALAMLWSGTRDVDERVRAAAMGALVRLAEPDSLTAVLNLYDGWAADAGASARVAALRYVGAAVRLAPPTEEVAARIAGLRVPSNGDELAAGRAITLLGHWPAPPDPPELPGVAWYESLVRMYVVPSLRGENPRVELATDKGSIVIELFAADAPLTVNNFLSLVASGYYAGSRFHRVVPNFVIQDGDPTGTGSGGPGYRIRDELNLRRYERGVLGMAHAGADTGGSQYFITHSPQPHLDGLHTVFGRVLEGMETVDAIVQGDAIVRVVRR